VYNEVSSGCGDPEAQETDNLDACDTEVIASTHHYSTSGKF
jgi:hypothetical protein